MKTKVGRIPGVVWLCVACLGLVPLAASCSSRKSYKLAYERGLSHAEKGDHDKAIADLTEAIRLEPEKASRYLSRGLSHAENGDHDKAIADLTEAIRLEPKNILAHSCRAKAYRALGDEVKAASDENRAQELKK